MMVKWTKDKVIEEILSRAQRILPLNYQAVVNDDEKLAGAARRYFGSWDKALSVAGFDPEEIKKEARSKPRRPKGTWTKEKVIEEIRAAAREGQDLSAHRMQKYNGTLVSTAQQLFSGWDNALIAAGYAPDLIRRAGAWTDEELLERIRQLDEQGADLSDRTAAAYDQSLYGVAIDRYKSWSTALDAAGVAEDKRTVKWSKSKIIHAIISGRRDTMIRQAAKLHFGSWTKALQEARVPEEKAQIVGNNIRERRKELGWSQQQLGDAIGYSHRYIGTLENGQIPDPRISVALKLAKVFDCNVEDIFDLK